MTLWWEITLPDLSHNLSTNYSIPDILNVIKLFTLITVYAKTKEDSVEIKRIIICHQEFFHWSNWKFTFLHWTCGYCNMDFSFFNWDLFCSKWYFSCWMQLQIISFSQNEVSLDLKARCSILFQPRS